MTADELVKNFTRISRIGRREQVCNRHLDLFKLLCAKIVMLRFRRKKMLGRDCHSIRADTHRSAVKASSSLLVIKIKDRVTRHIARMLRTPFGEADLFRIQECAPITQLRCAWTGGVVSFSPLTA
jgi:hypothetical protein